MTDNPLPNIDDMEILYLQDRGATSDNINDAWMEVFLANGATSTEFNTAAQEFLLSIGAPYTNVTDNWKWFWCVNGGDIGPAELFFDSFTDVNNTLIQAHTPDVNTFAAGWVNQQEFNPNSAQIFNNQISGGSASYNQVHVETLLNNCTLQAKYSGGLTASPAGLMFRKVDTDNCWTLERYDSGTNIDLKERVAGSWVVRDSIAIGSPAYPFDAECVLNDNLISYTIAGVSGSFQSAVHQAATKHGIRIGDGRFMDDFRILK
jgi:hypothetical protein